MMKRSLRELNEIDPFPPSLPDLEELLNGGGDPLVLKGEVRTCRSCNTKKVEDDFIHPTKGVVGRTCSSCIMKRSGAAAKGVADLEVSRTLADHEARLAQLELRPPPRAQREEAEDGFGRQWKSSRFADLLRHR